MSERFLGLKKVPKDPAMRLMALANIKFQGNVTTPASAPVADVLAALDKEEDRVTGALDMLRLMSAALPPRERTWWACLAARDVLGADAADIPEPLKAAEAWVRKPNDENRAKIRAALDVAEPDDDTTLAAIAAIFADGTLGPGEMKDQPAPPGAAHGACFGINVMALGAAGDGFEAAAQHLVNRALDLARGGNGKSEPLVSFLPETSAPQEPIPEEEEEEATS